MTRTWQQHALQREQAEQAMGCYHDNNMLLPPCSFAFVAAPAGTIRSEQALKELLLQVAKINQGWGVETTMANGWRAKLGVVAQRPQARLVLRMDRLKSPIQVITIHYVKSYGDKWANSTLQCTMNVWKQQQQPNEEQQPSSSISWVLQGFHDLQSSISYHFRRDVGPEHRAEVGDAVELDMELVGGSTFKIISLMMCYR
jgi:hypothetical protein